ncbi:MAG: hypothetical protein J1F06_05375 [Prevotellaceae bacterium]|nr:hypothetical protein [Prevotellaceae bacterium]
MTREEEKQLQTFETRVRSLILSYGQLRRENARLRAELERGGENLEQARAEIRRLENDMRKLRDARTIELTDSDVEATRARLARLIREVDKCIALLSV